MRVGYAVRDITPEPGLTLSGFASRCEKPSTGVDDPISVQALAVEDEGQLLLLLVFDLLALGEALTAEIVEVAQRVCASAGLPTHVVPCCTHTHSAPATIKLIGCGIPDRRFWELVVKASAQVTLDAMAALRPASMRYVTKPVTNVSYNRRLVLEDGRVVMSVKPDKAVVKVGPTCDRFLLVRFDDENGDGIAGIANWAAHPCVVCSQNVSADYPGELRRRLWALYGVPFLYLQGACANINLPFRNMNRQEMLEDVDAVMLRLSEVAWPAADSRVRSELLSSPVRLTYGPVPQARELESFRDGMSAIAATGSGPDDVSRTLANILNVDPGEQADPAMVRHIAAALSQWSRELLANYSNLPKGRTLAVTIWEMGDLVFCFVAAEVFAETAIRLQSAIPEKTIAIAGYASPLAGYLPTDEALIQGGYEVEYAYRFYGHPAPLAAGSEPAVYETLIHAINA